MTKQMAKVLDFVTRFIAEHGYSPTYAEIAEHLGLRSKGYVAKLIARLQQRGDIAVLPRRARGIVLTGRGVTVDMSAAMLARVNACATRLGVTAADVVGAALSEYFERRQEPGALS